MVQVELFEEEEASEMEDELNKFLEKIADEDILKINYEVRPLLAASGVLRVYYEALVVYRVK